MNYSLFLCCRLGVFKPFFITFADMKICVKEITKRFKNIECISNVSFTCERGEITGILAPRGNGKTLLLNLLVGRTKLDIGSIDYFVNGNLIPKEEIRQYVGFLSANTSFYPQMIVYDFLIFCAELYGLPKYQRRNRVQNLIKKCKLSKCKHKFIAELSKGQLQRLGIAQALLHNPPFLFLDEPVTVLDPGQSEQLYEIIKECAQERCVLLTSSRMRDMEALCDTMLVLSEGKVLAKGTVQELQQEVANSSILKVKIAAKNSDEVYKELQQIDYVQVLRSDGFSFDIHTTYEERFARDLFDLCTKNGWYILRFVAAEKTLEDIFKQLRKN